MIHYDAMTLVDDNHLVVEIDCETCVNGSPTDRCTCFNGREYEHADLTTLLNNLAVAGALCEARLPGRRGWYPGCGKPWRPDRPQGMNTRKPGCTCFREEGDSACNVHGEELPDGSIAVRCQTIGCLATCDVDILSSSAWMLVANGWLCTEHQPL